MVVSAGKMVQSILRNCACVPTASADDSSASTVRGYPASRMPSGGRPVTYGVDEMGEVVAAALLLFAVVHPRWEFVFQPKYAAYLNLIEPCQ